MHAFTTFVRYMRYMGYKMSSDELHDELQM